MKIDQEKINRCISSSFLTTEIDIADNTLLSTEKKRYYDEGIQIWPSVRISNMSFRVNFKFFVIFFFYLIKKNITFKGKYL